MPRWCTKREISIFLNVSPDLLDILHLGRESMGAAIAANLIISTIVGLAAGVFALVPHKWSNALLAGMAFVLLMGIMQELMSITFGNKDWYKPIGEFIYAKKGLSWGGTALFLILGILFSLWRSGRGVKRSRYRRWRWHPRDTALAAGSGLMLAGVVALAWFAPKSLFYYPYPPYPLLPDFHPLIGLLFALPLLPAMLLPPLPSSSGPSDAPAPP
jgi:hypothetical protein